jgi:hypothetical protein
MGKRIRKYKYRYEYKTTFIGVGTDKTFSNPNALSISTILKKSLTKHGITIDMFVDDMGMEFEKCRICNSTYPPLNFICEINPSDEIVISSLEFTRDYVYCYGTNVSCTGIQMNPNSVEFISKVMKLSDLDAMAYIKKNNRSPFYKENWNNEEEYRQSQSRNLDYYKKHHGVNAERQFENHINKIKYSNSLSRYIDNYGIELGTEIFTEISSKKDSSSMVYYLEKNNEDYVKALFEYKERIKQCSLSLDALINRNGIDFGTLKYEENARKKLVSQKAFLDGLSKEEKKTKYGMTREKLGDEKYEKWRLSVSVPLARASKESMVLINDIIDTIDLRNDELYYGYGEKNEYFIHDGSNIYFYDFVIKTQKIIIEYNGVVFHPKFENINKFTPIYGNLTAEEMYNKQKYKIDLATKNGFKVLEVWSDDPDKLTKSIDYITKNMNKI